MSEEMLTVRCTKCDEWIAWPIYSDADPICIECEKVPLSRALTAEARADELQAERDELAAQLAGARAALDELTAEIGVLREQLGEVRMLLNADKVKADEYDRMISWSKDAVS